MIQSDKVTNLTDLSGIVILYFRYDSAVDIYPHRVYSVGESKYPVRVFCYANRMIFALMRLS